MTPDEFRETVIEMDRLTDHADAVRDVAEIQSGRAKAIRRQATALAQSLEPTLANLPEGTYVQCYDWVFWVNEDGLNYQKTISWQDLPVEPPSPLSDDDLATLAYQQALADSGFDSEEIEDHAIASILDSVPHPDAVGPLRLEER